MFVRQSRNRACLIKRDGKLEQHKRTYSRIFRSCEEDGFAIDKYHDRNLGSDISTSENDGQEAVVRRNNEFIPTWLTTTAR